MQRWSIKNRGEEGRFQSVLNMRHPRFVMVRVDPLVEYPHLLLGVQMLLSPVTMWGQGGWVSFC